MEIIKSKTAMRQLIRTLQKTGKTIGFVPTMGYLHEGHLNLATHSIKENDITVMSIFVNRLQFGPTEDFESYPRDTKRDIALAEEAGIDILFVPDHSDIYDQEVSFEIKVLKRTNVLCGKSRPGHFDGVATILIKLFNIVLPDRVYMGLKDAQQVAVVDSLIHYFDFPIELIPVETVREADGLARSSRNVNLTNNEREQASLLYQALLSGKELIINGQRKTETIIKSMNNFIEENVELGKIDYIDILSFPQLEKLPKIHGKVILAIAVKFSKARLIDNMIVEIDE